MTAGSAPSEINSPAESGTPPHGDPTADAAAGNGADADFDDDQADAGDGRDEPGDEPEPSAQ